MVVWLALYIHMCAHAAIVHDSCMNVVDSGMEVGAVRDISQVSAALQRKLHTGSTLMQFVG
jgi:hypothetical protein